MSYGFDNATDKSGKAGFPVAADVDNVFIKEAEYVERDGKEGYIKVTYQREKSTLIDFIFPVNPEKIKEWNPGLSEDKLVEMIQDRKNALASKLLHILTKYDVTKDQLTASFAKNAAGDNSFKAFATFFVKVLNSKISPDILLYMKTIRKPNGFTSVPEYAGFLQRMDDGDCRMTYTDREKERNAENKKSQPAKAAMEVVDDDIEGLDNLDDLI